MTPTLDSLAELEQRAGASDENRDAWLAERRQGVTATEVRDLYIRAKSSAKLVATKLGWEPEPELKRLPRIAWGREREPVIADMLRTEGFALEHRVFHHAENPRYLASPDGIRIDFDETIDVAEIKSAEEQLEPGSEALEELGYRIQCMWTIYVLGARRCRFAVEECIPLGGGRYEAGELRRYWIERDDELIEELRVLADDFLATLDDVAENGWDPVAVALLEDALATRAAQEKARQALEDYCASTGVSSLRIPEGSLSYSTPAPRASFDQGAFKAAHPEMAQEFMKTTPASKPTLRVTPARTKKEAV